MRLSATAENNSLAMGHGPSFIRASKLAHPGFDESASEPDAIFRKASCACGGGCPACQAKTNDLRVSRPDDPAEIEADAIADRVMRIPAVNANQKALDLGAFGIKDHTSGLPIHRKCNACDDEEEGLTENVVLRKEALPLAAPIPPADSPPAIRNVIDSGGRPLDPQSRDFFEPRFGLDLSGVRIHTDAAASRSAESVDAKAYTMANNIVFGSGEYKPETDSGKQLLAHELVHTIQQKSPGTIHRKGNGRPAPKTNAAANSTTQSSAPIVEDVQITKTGQMRRTEFLNTLQDRLIAECDIELAKAGRTAHNCPYILRSIEYYRNRPLSQLLRLIRVFAGPAAGSNAQALINATVARARKAAKKLAQQGGPRLQSMTESGRELEIPHDPTAVRSKMGSGRPLDEPVRREMERSFGADLGSVRIHTDVASSRQSSELGAKAFTIGNDIAFSEGRYAPDTREGKYLLAHELTHTIQQAPGPATTLDGPGDRELEDQANMVADAVMEGQKGVGSIAKRTRTGPRISRDPVDDTIIAIALVAALEGGGEVAVVEGGAIVLTEATAEVVVVESAPVVFGEAAPLLVEAAPLVSAAAPIVAEAAPLVSEAAPIVSSAPSAFSTAATAATAVAATTLSSDSPATGDVDQDLDEERRRGRCSYMSVAQQFGRYPCHGAYAASISGVNREVRVTTPEGISVDYDAMDWGESLYEVKTGYRWMVFSPDRQDEIAARFWAQATEQLLVAEECGHPLTWYFNDPYVASFFGAENSPYPAYFTVPMPVPVWYRPFNCDVDSDD